MFIIKPRWKRVRWLPFGIQAIMLFPWILYVKDSFIADPCHAAHEEFHFYECAKVGVLLWYAWYVLELIVDGLPYWLKFKPLPLYEMHSFEVRAMRVENACRVNKINGGGMHG